MVSGQLEKHVTSMSFGLEPAIWSRDTGQQILCFDRRQLIIACMSNIKEVHGKPRLHVSVNLLYLEYGRHVARLRRRRRRAYVPTSNTASHDNHDKIISWVSFCFPYEYGAPLGDPSSRRSSAINHLVKSFPKKMCFNITLRLHQIVAGTNIQWQCVPEFRRGYRK